MTHKMQSFDELTANPHTPTPQQLWASIARIQEEAIANHWPSSEVRHMTIEAARTHQLSEADLVMRGIITPPPPPPKLGLKGSRRAK